MNKRRRYLAKRRRAEWNRLHISALTWWSTLPMDSGTAELRRLMRENHEETWSKMMANLSSLCANGEA